MTEAVFSISNLRRILMNPMRILRAFRDAIRGTECDYTEGSLSRAITLLAVPMVLEMSMESIFAICDILFVSKLGHAATATVGLTESMLTILYAIAIGLSMSTTALVARRIGEKKPQEAARVAFQAIAIGISLATVIAIFAAPRAATLLSWMDASPEVIEQGQGYTAILFATNAVIMILFLANAVFRGAGDASIALRVLVLANGINLVLDPCLIFGLGPFPELGLEGAAIATSIGRGVGVLFQVWILVRGTGRLHISIREMKVLPSLMAHLIRVSLGGIAQFLVATASWVALMRIVSSFGSATTAGYTIAIRIVVFALLPSFGLSNAAATLVGQNLGAEKPDRAERSVWITGVFNMVFLTSVSVIFLALPDVLVRFFDRSADVASVAETGLRVISYGFVFYAWGMVTVQAFNGAGDTLTPTWVNLFCFWVCQLPIAYFLARHTSQGIDGVFWAVAICYSLSAVVGLALFRRGRWKLKKV